MKEHTIHNLIPHFIHKKFQAGETFGQFKAITLFMDISGFTAMTQTFMQHGKAGAEELAQVINAIFKPIILAYYEQGGFVTGFAGDALTVVFPTYSEQASLKVCITSLAVQQIMATHKHYQTQFGSFELAVKQGLSAGLVEWGIIGPAEHKTFFFRGTAIDNCANAEHQATATDIILDEHIQALLPVGSVELIMKNGRYAQLKQLSPTIQLHKTQPNPITLSKQIYHQFFPQELWQYSGQGEFRQTSIVFLAFKEGLSQSSLNQLVTQVIQECDQFDGHFAEVDFGDKGGLVVIYFGAPKAHENDIARALGFSLAISKKLIASNYSHRIGIAYGLVYAGMVGSPLRSKYSVLGNVINFAARLMSKANWGQILVSATTAQQPGFAFTHVGDFDYKGFSKPIPTYQLIGQTRDYQNPKFTNETHIVGRDNEKQQLIDFTKPLLDGQTAGIAFIYGEPGIGKSVLMVELQTHFNHSINWIVGQADQILHQAFNPFIAILQIYFQQTTDATEAENKASFIKQWQILKTELNDSNASPKLRQEYDRTQSILGALLDLHWDGSLYEQLDGELRHENTITAVKVWLFAQCCLHPTALVLEDGHWRDHASHEVLTNICQEMADYPLLILITSRYLDNGHHPEFKLATHLPLLKIDLKTLSPSSLRQQIEQILNGPINDNFFALLQERTQANPFFSQQMIYYFQENELLIRDNEGKWTIAVDEIAIPNSINAILISRIDRLSQHVKEVVQTAAVLGNQFEIDIISQVLKANVSQEIKQAETNQIWRALSELKYIFKHVLLREAAYGMQMRQHLKQLHQLAAEAYEHLYQTDLSHHYATLAYHYKYAAVKKKEKQYARLAGEQASHKGNQKEAIIYFSRALELADDSEIFDLLLLREDAYHLLGDRGNQAEDLITLVQRVMLAPKSAPDDKTHPLKPASPAHLKRYVEVILRQARYRSAISDYSATAVAAQRALHLARESRDPLLQIRSRYWWGESLVRLARYREALKQFNLGLDLLQNLDNPDTTARFLKEMGWIAFREGNPQLATRYLEEALNLVQQSGNQREQMMVLKALGGAANASGDYTLARNWQKEGLSIAQTIGHRMEEGSLLNNLGNTSRFLGEFETAVSFHHRGLILLKKTGWRMGEAISHINLGLVYPYLGEYKKAFDNTQNGLQLAQAIHARMIEAAAWYILGNIAVETKNFTEAVSVYQKSLELYRSVSLPHYVAEANAGLIRTYLAQQGYEKVKQPLSEILDYLDSGGSVSSVEEPMRVYLTCYQALNALNDPRTPKFLQHAYDVLQTKAARLPDLQTRQSMIENIPFHHEIMLAME